MKQKQTNKLTYKMYKKGRFWIFAGMAVVTINLNALTSRADTTEQASSATTTSESTKASAISQSQVTLTSSTSTSSTDTTTAKAVSQASETESTKAATTSSSQAAAASTSTTPTTSSSEKAASELTTATSNAKPIVNGTNKTIKTTNQATSSDTSTAAAIKPVTTTDPATATAASDATTTDSITASEADTAATNLTTEQTDQLAHSATVSELNQLTTTNLAAAAVQENKLSRASLAKAAVVESGTKLGVDYTITADGVLTIQGGNLQNTSSGAGSPWVADANIITKVVIAGPIIASPTMSSLFDQLSNVTEFVGLDLIDVSAVTDMSYLFRNDNAVQNLDLSSWGSKTGNVKDLSLAFYHMPSLKTLNLNNLNVSKVTNMMQTFSMGDWLTPSTIEEIDVANWDTRSVTNMTNLFASNAQLSKLDLSTWQHTESVTSMQSMFSGDTSLTQLDTSGFNTSKVTQMGSMFSGVAVSKLDVSNFDVSSVTSADDMFANMANLTSLTLGPNFQLANASISGLFQSDPLLETLDLGSFKNPLNQQNWGMFSGDTNLKKLILGAGVNLNQIELNPGHPQPVVGLPDIKATAVYTGKWVDETNPSGPAYTSTELTQLYNGTTGPDGVTYIWQVTSQSKLVAKDNVSVVAGPKSTWSPQDSVTEILDANGNAVDLATTNSVVKIDSVNGDPTGTVDTSQPGTYTVQLSYTDATGTTQTATTLVTVVATQATIDAKATTVIAGKGSWTAADNFVSATDADGNALTVDQVESDGSVDLQTPGQYSVTYHYVDRAGNVATKTIQVTVTKPQSGLNVHDTELIAGPKTSWQAADNFISATDVDGQAISLQNITVEGTVQTETPGDYPVTYHFTDSRGNEYVKTITVHVAASQAALKTNDSTVQVGDNWQASDNVAIAKDINGQPITVDQLTVTGKVDMTVAGTYPVTYHYTDALYGCRRKRLHRDGPSDGS
ncbi:bacterial Ig-like domain-containing protein [Lactiplantibacillus pingfangensis]|uniref:bacterial Ig-like domain-containing protein n=1 Tax=Lactiplantibacillus pingfangensis TaxID=2559915 RepID=UPI001484D643|nr:bacterial Ig-like domain-containing protein [Lactiplantibacillus pingfangensis]